MGTAAVGAAAIGAVAGAKSLFPAGGAATLAGEARELVTRGGMKEASPIPRAALPHALTTAVPSTYDYTADVVVVGMGFAGLSTAITASDLGANVLVLEKAPQNFAGGNSRVCGQCVWVPGTDQNGNVVQSPSVLYNEQVYFEQMADGQGFPTDDTLIQTLVLNSANNKTWFEGLGATMEWYGLPPAVLSAVHGSLGGLFALRRLLERQDDAAVRRQLVLPSGQLAQRNINVMYSPRPWV